MAKPNKVAATPPSSDKKEEGEKENEGSAEANPVPTVLTTVATDEATPNEERTATSEKEPESDTMDMNGDSE